MEQRATIGAFFKIPIDENFHTYCRIIYNKIYAFYDFKTDIDQHNLEEIEKAKILFKVLVHRSAIHRGNWKKIGVRPLPGDLDKPVPFFIQEIGMPEICWIELGGERTKVSPSECVGVERFAIWESHHIEERLRSYYNDMVDKNTIILRVNGIL